MGYQGIEVQAIEPPFGELNLGNILRLLAIWLNEFGFLTPEDGADYVKIPRQFIVETMRKLKGAAVSVVLYLFGHSWAYGEYDKKLHLTFDEFVNGRKRADGTRMDEGTGLSENTIRTALIQAEEVGVITCHVDDRDLGRIDKYYGIKTRIPSEEEKKQLEDRKTRRTSDKESSTLARGSKIAPLDLKNCTPGPQKLEARGSKIAPRSVVITKERTLSNNLEEVVVPPTTSSVPNGKSSSHEPSHYGMGYGGNARPIPALTEDGQRFYDFYCRLPDITVPPNLTEKLAGECNSLGIYVKTFEQFQSWVAVTRKKLPPKAKDDIIYPKNMQNVLNAWMKTQQPSQSNASASPSAPTEQLANMTYEEADQLARDAIAKGMEMGYSYQAEAVPSKKVEGKWLVKVTWIDPWGKDLLARPLKSREQWQAAYQEIDRVWGDDLKGGASCNI
ncbi:MAG TPA: hypothetical protein VKR06_46035 [Ktedonosporobacter sp.]|nr:hypothetical protein [Ktedonosporobacter sp.]